jgi:hypothetical protein
MSYRVRYVEGSDLARRFPTTRYPWRGPGIPTREEAEKLCAACPNAEVMEVYEVEED